VGQLLQDRIETDRVAGFDGFDERDFDKNLLGRRGAEMTLRLRQHFHDPGERIGGESGRLRR
jgi:hypothetical protein